MAIAALCTVSKGKVRTVRDTQHTLCIGLVPPRPRLISCDDFAVGANTPAMETNAAPA
ncbi:MULTISPECIES: hypothetical protein [unclassified Crossiella]|uniref:hypothetical protein n=1 Tax=unclassified Crossiella TaxID=2620835 RepID=UPI001FFEA004|nr:MULTISPECIES: hypothetical protein [unclassified Crossiella]MCK2245288.1 hypothetical protein [Crossiella sp. S99.2]MCK2258940.1 hypothetical protein [Crossiella sp. S99.1]